MYDWFSYFVFPRDPAMKGRLVYEIQKKTQAEVNLSDTGTAMGKGEMSTTSLVSFLLSHTYEIYSRCFYPPCYPSRLTVFSGTEIEIVCNKCKGLYVFIIHSM